MAKTYYIVYGRQHKAKTRKEAQSYARQWNKDSALKDGHYRAISHKRYMKAHH